MLNLLPIHNFSLPTRRFFAGMLTVLLGFVLSACGPRDDARALAAECLRSASTLAPIMGGPVGVPCAAAPAGLASEAPVARTAIAWARPDRALVASAR
ncbi:hypothetical protein QTI33_06440 [Variovorax sp. J22P271]|uniref:hypothetical protein n=1 Tax=Variovorax davisae TaxID=3053515 RepID=UPI00257896C4|nr:hypothetical protein [Variovorax sp. J22P271]MDM0031782.1 hypothetical protein [Variovorax sp. J22P271]